MENHNSEPIMLKRGQTIGVVTSCVVKQEEKGQTPVEHIMQRKGPQSRIMRQTTV